MAALLGISDNLVMKGWLHGGGQTKTKYVGSVSGGEGANVASRGTASPVK